MDPEDDTHSFSHRLSSGESWKLFFLLSSWGSTEWVPSVSRGFTTSL